MILENILMIANVVVLVVAAAFVIFYSGFKFEQSAEGRNIMALAVFLLVLSAGFLIDDWNKVTGQILTLIAAIGIAITLIDRIKLIKKARPRLNKETTRGD